MHLQIYFKLFNFKLNICFSVSCFTAVLKCSIIKLLRVDQLMDAWKVRKPCTLHPHHAIGFKYFGGDLFDDVLSVVVSVVVINIREGQIRLKNDIV